jgi:glycosyltransferase involved in cell wall biosynthesis
MVISIVIPALNEEAVIERTLKNMSRMTLFPYELIVSDGNSTDRTVQLAEKYTDKILIHRGPERQTIGAARNLGAGFAEYEYLVFLDADVIIPDPDAFFRKAIEIFHTDPDTVAITVSLKVFEESETWADRIIFTLVNCAHFLMNNFFGRGSASGEFQMIRRSSFREAGGYNESLVVAEDNDMFARLSGIGKTRMVYGLEVRHTGRRAHRIGWPRLLMSWWVNGLSVALFKRAACREWKPIR